MVKYAKGKSKAIEIGTYMGVSATIIATEMTSDGTLYCVDPYERSGISENPCYLISMRQFKRAGILSKIVILRGYSTDDKVKSQIPSDLDFAFVDGDHSYSGLKNDWELLRKRLKVGGIALLHDTTIPKEEPYRNFGSVDYFNNVIVNDPLFERVDEVYSINVMRKVSID